MAVDIFVSTVSCISSILLPHSASTQVSVSVLHLPARAAASDWGASSVREERRRAHTGHVPMLLLLLFKMPSALSFMSPASCCLAHPTNWLLIFLRHVCHHVTMTQCHRVTMSPCHHVTMSLASCCLADPSNCFSQLLIFLLFPRLLSRRTPLAIASLHCVFGVTHSAHFSPPYNHCDGWEPMHLVN